MGTVYSNTPNFSLLTPNYNNLSLSDKLLFVKLIISYNINKYNSARDQLGAAIESTCMPTEEFDAAAEKFDAVVNKIENGETESETNFLMDILTKLLKFVNDFMLKIFGGKGFSEFFK